MCWFKKKKSKSPAAPTAKVQGNHEQEIKESAALLKKITGLLGACVNSFDKIGVTDADVIKRANEVKRRIEFGNPTVIKEATKIDEEIYSIVKAMDTDIDISIAKKEDVAEKMTDYVLKLERLVDKRKAYVD